jgi:hypothetical protein
MRAKNEMSTSVKTIVIVCVCQQEMMVLKVNWCVLVCKVCLGCVSAGVLIALELSQFPDVCWRYAHNFNKELIKFKYNKNETHVSLSMRIAMSITDA